MAGLQDVVNALVGLAGGAVYPQGTGQPSVSGGHVRVFPGWPLPEKLEEDLAKDIAQVSVFPLDMEERTTRFSEDWKEIARSAPSLVPSVVGTTVTLSGTTSYPLNLTLVIDDKAYTYPLQQGDELSTVASAIATNIAVDRTATSNGAVITVPNALSIVARTGQSGNTIREIKRQERVFQITIWAPSPDARSLLAEAIDIALAKLRHVSLPDGTSGRLTYQKSPVTDDLSRVALYRRDLRYSVDWATTETTTATEITINEAIIRDSQANILQSSQS